MASPVVGARNVMRLASTALAAGTFDSSGIPEIRMNTFNTLVLLCDLTLNTATSVEIVVDVATPADPPQGHTEAAPVATDWFQLATCNYSGLTISGGTAVNPEGASYFQLGATGRYAIVIPNLMTKYVRVRAKTTAGPGSTTLAVTGLQGNS